MKFLFQFLDGQLDRYSFVFRHVHPKRIENNRNRFSSANGYDLISGHDRETDQAAGCHADPECRKKICQILFRPN